MGGSSNNNQANPRSASQASQAAANQRAAQAQNASLSEAEQHSAQAGAFGTNNGPSSAANRNSDAAKTSNPSIGSNILLQPTKSAGEKALENEEKDNPISNEPPPRNRQNNPLISTPQIGDKGYVSKGNSGSGFGNGRITFDKSGNTLQDNKIVSFAGQQAKETFLSNQGLGNNGTITNQAKFAFADFRPIANYNLSGVAGDKNNPEPSPFVGDARVKFEESNFAYNLLTKGKTENQPPPERFTNDQLVALGKSGNAEQEKLGSDSIFRGSAKEDQVKQSEADRASKYYSSSFNNDYFTGGKKPLDDNIWHPPVGNVYTNMGQGINGSEFNKGTVKEQNDKLTAAKQSEADKATSLFFNSKKEENTSYLTGGKPDNQGGVVTPQSAGKSYGYDWINGQLGTKQLVRGSQEEQILTSNFVNRNTSAKNFGTPFNADLIGRSDKKTTGFQGISVNEKPKSQPAPITSQVEGSQQSMSAKDFKSFIEKGQKDDATFLFFSGNKQVGQTLGPRSYGDYFRAKQNYGDNLTVQETFPSREKELTNAVSKNTAFYSSLPPNYWDALSKAGYLSKNNAGKINDQINLNAKIQNRENLSLLQGSLLSEIHGGPIPTEKGVKNIGPADNEVASFLKFPFAGQKVSTSNIPSTSYTNVLQFLPGLGNKEIELASRGLESLLSKSGPKIIGFRDTTVNKARSVLQEKTLSSADYFSQKSIRATNLKELEPVGIQIAKQTVGKRPETVQETSLRLGGSIKENPNYTPSRNVFNPTPQPTFDINFKTETPVFRNVEKTSNTASPKEQEIFTRYPLSSLKSNDEFFTEPRSTPSSSSTSLLKNKSALPFARPTEANTQLSPVSREFFGVQFKGNYPEKYLPEASSFTSTPSKPVVNLEERGDYQDWRFQRRSSQGPFNFGFRVGKEREKVDLPTQKDYQDFRFSQYEKSTGSKEPNVFDILGKTLPTKAERLQNNPQLPERSEDVLGRNQVKGGLYGGKVPLDIYKSSLGHSDTGINAREFFGLAGEKVSKGTGLYTGKLPAEDFGLVGQQGKREGDIAFFNRETGVVKREYLTAPEKTGRSGPLDIFSAQSDSGRSIFPNSKGGKYYASDEVYPYGNSFVRGSLQTKDIGLIKFEKYQKANPEPEKIGDSRFDTFVAKLPKGNKKAAVFNNIFETKTKSNFKSSSAKLFETKKEEPKKGTEFSNKGSKSETILLQKPLVKRKLVSSTEQQYDYGYEFRPVITSKTESSLSIGIMSGLKIGVLPGFSVGSKSKQESRYILGNLNKTLELTKPRSRLGERQSPKLFSEQSPKSASRISFDIAQKPKQGTKPKQTSMLLPKMTTPQRPRVAQKPVQDVSPRFTFRNPTPPKKAPPVPLLFGPYGKDKNYKSKSGPTGLVNLNVKNPFSSSLNINVTKNNRVEF